MHAVNTKCSFEKKKKFFSYYSVSILRIQTLRFCDRLSSAIKKAERVLLTSI